MTRLHLIIFTCIITLLFGKTPALHAFTINDFTTFGTATRIGNTINYSSGGPVGGFYASNILIPNNFKSVSFDFSGTSYTPSSGIDFYFKVFEGAPFSTGWNGDGAIFHTIVPPREYYGDNKPLGPPSSASYSGGVDLTRYRGETISLGWVFTTDCGPAIASISNIDFEQDDPTPTPEPSTMALMVIGLIGVAMRFKWVKKT